MPTLKTSPIQMSHVTRIAPLLDAARVSIAPLRYGAGMKGKVAEALAAGLPVVTTSMGAEGMGLVDGEHLLVGDDVDALADAIVRLSTDDDLWRRLAAAGRARIDERYSPETVAHAVRGVVETAIDPVVPLPRANRCLAPV